MRIGFFYGISGDAAALAAAFELLEDCDRIVSLGDLVSEPGAGDAACLAPLAAEGGKLLLLGGRGEQGRSHDRSLPEELRTRLKALPTVSVEQGIALLGGANVAANARRSGAGDEPKLVAPLTVAASPAGTRVWRAAGGLARVEALAGPVCLPLGAERLRLDLGPAVDGSGLVQVAVIDREAGILKLREKRIRGAAAPAAGAAVQRAPRKPARRRAPAMPGQQLLAV